VSALKLDTEAIDRLFLELSQFTHATTAKELALRAEVARLRKALEWIVQPDHPIGSNAEFAIKASAVAQEALNL
jgi:hypothetical protein